MELRTGSTQVVKALAFQLNALRDAMVGSNVHAQVTPSAPPSDDPNVTIAELAITAAAPTTLATRRLLANDCKRVLNAHFKDMAAHKSVQSAAITTADVNTSTGTEADCITLANACRTAFTTGGHINTTNVHHNNDATNTITAAAATDTSSLDALLTELKSDINAHILLGLAGQHVVLTGA